VLSSDCFAIHSSFSCKWCELEYLTSGSQAPFYNPRGTVIRVVTLTALSIIIAFFVYEGYPHLLSSGALFIIGLFSILDALFLASIIWVPNFKFYDDHLTVYWIIPRKNKIRQFAYSELQLSQIVFRPGGKWGTPTPYFYVSLKGTPKTKWEFVNVTVRKSDRTLYEWLSERIV